MSIDKPNSVALCAAAYRAEQMAGVVMTSAHGMHGTTGYKVFFEQSLIEIFPPQFVLRHVPPAGMAAEIMTPFEVHVSFPAASNIAQVIVHDANGAHEVLVEQVPDTVMQHANLHGLPPELFQHWRHSFEDDVDDVQVYRPSAYPFPSAFGRIGFEIKPDGIFTQYDTGPADEPVVVAGRWNAVGTQQLHVNLEGPPHRAYLLTIVSIDKQMLLIKKKVLTN